MNLEEAEGLMRAWRSWTGIFSGVVGSSGGLGILWNPVLIKVEELIKTQAW